MAADLEFRIGAELTEIKGALASLQRDFQKTGQAAQQASQRGDFSRLERNVSGAITQVRGLAGAFVSLAGAIAVIRQADELNSLNARLKLASANTAEFTRAQAELFAMSQRTRTSLGETISLYSRIAQATKDAGVGQNVLLGVVETINQAVQLSGASAQAAEAALVQLGQGLASGTLRGEELNSILEQTPALADAIAKGLGITRGELRKYGEEGKLTAQAVIEALQRQRNEIAQQFAELPLTVGQAVTQLSNAGLQLLGVFDEASGATGGLAEAISDLAEFLSSPQVLGAVQDFAATWGAAFEEIGASISRTLDIIRSELPEAVEGGNQAVGFLARAFRELPANVTAWVQLLTVQLAARFDRIAAGAERLRDGIAALFNEDTLAAVEARYARRLEAIAQAERDSVAEILNRREETLGAADRRREQQQENQRLANRAAAGRDLNARGNFRRQVSNQEAQQADALRKAQLDARARLEQDAANRELAIERERFEDGLTAAADYYRRREALELAALDRSIAIEQQRAASAKNGAERAKALAEITLLERQKGDVQRQAARDQAQFQRELDRELNQARAQDLENQGKAGDAARIRLQAQYADLLRKLGKDSEEARLIQRLIDTGVAQAQFRDLQTQFEQVLENLERKRAEIANRVRIGAISPAQARQEEAAAGQDATAKLQGLATATQALAQATNDPAIVAGLTAINDAMKRIGEEGVTGMEKAIQDLRASLADMEASFAQAAASAGVDALSQLFTDLAEKPEDAGEALKQFVVNFVQSMAQIAARALATFAVLQLLDAIYPNLGRAVAAGMSATVSHGGGIVGDGGQRRTVNPLLFAGAPRYHSGGMVGLKPDERPAILQTGEEVLSRSDPRNRANGGGNGYRIVNVLDPSLVEGFLQSSAGERAVLNVIGRNPAAVKQTIGA